MLGKLLYHSWKAWRSYKRFECKSFGHIYKPMIVKKVQVGSYCQGCRIYKRDNVVYVEKF